MGLHHGVDVGYGDKYPITTEGRIVATLLIVSGVGLFAVYTAFIAKLFIADDKKDDTTQIKILTEEIRLLRLRIDQWENRKEKAQAETDTVEAARNPPDN